VPKSVKSGVGWRKCKPRVVYRACCMKYFLHKHWVLTYVKYWVSLLTPSFGLLSIFNNQITRSINLIVSVDQRLTINLFKKKFKTHDRRHFLWKKFACYTIQVTRHFK
jgi:hypothetical protein